MSTAEALPTVDHRSTVMTGASSVNGAPRRAEHLERRFGQPRAGTAGEEGSALFEEFAATVAHELRTPLAIVELAAETVLARRDDLAPDQLTEMLRVIQRNSMLATLMLGRLERGHRAGAGTVHLERERVDLTEIVWETTSDLAELLLRWHPTEVHTPATLYVHADPTAVREILFNLLSNAVKYSPRGSYIDVTVVQRQDEAQLTVRDRGRGLTRADAARVFEKYQQADPRDSGVGLGLAVSRALARAHGGDLDVCPATARGSEFRLTLPNAAVDC